MDEATRQFIEEYQQLCIRHKRRLAVDMDFTMSVIPLTNPEEWLQWFLDEMGIKPRD